MDSSNDSVGIDVPESLLCRQRRSPSMQNDTRIAVDLAKAVFEIAVSDRPGRVGRRERLPQGAVPELLCPAAGRHSGDGSVRLGALLGPSDRRLGTSRCSASAVPRPPVRATQQDGPHRRQGDPRSQPQRGHSTGSGQDRVPASPHVAAPTALRVDERAHRPHQLSARPAAGARSLHPGGRAPGQSRRCGRSSRMRMRTCPMRFDRFLPSCARRSVRSRLASNASRDSCRR